LIRPADPAYDDARAVWNAAIDRRPAAIARVADAADVRAALACARAHGLPVAVRGGGHHVAGLGTVDGGLVLDLGQMRAVTVDRRARTARVEAGARLGDLDRATQEYGLAVPAGQSADTGVAGLTLGGGTGWLMRKYGLTIDNLLAVELVTADGRLLRASAAERPDLFWGLRGGGGNFGVVTAFTYRLQPVGPIVLGGPLIYTLDRAGAALRAYRDFMAAAPDELTAFAVFATIPSVPPFPERLHGRPALAIDLCYAGPLEEGEGVVAPLRAFGPPALDLVGPIPYLVRQRMLDGTAPRGRHHYSRSGYLRDLPDAVIAALVAGFARVPSPLAQIFLARLGGAVARASEMATAFSGRDAAYLFWILGTWPPAGTAGPNQRWVRALAAALTPHATGGVYVNLIDRDEGRERVRAAYGAATYARLARLKAAYDPDNLFRLNHNIAPAAD
ncbi:MAG TPA: FAD-binding oxidoreductase, partial [Thermomicrobiales bacterium]|nr:FAD-binding oxidoreductase [Thermomicrobiales bacterium]